MRAFLVSLLLAASALACDFPRARIRTVPPYNAAYCYRGSQILWLVAYQPALGELIVVHAGGAVWMDKLRPNQKYQATVPSDKTLGWSLTTGRIARDSFELRKFHGDE